MSKLMLMIVVELTEMEMDEKDLLKYKQVCSRGGKQSSKAGAKTDAHAPSKGHIVRGGSASDSTDLRQKAAGLCLRSKQGLCAKTSKRCSY